MCYDTFCAAAICGNLQDSVFPPNKKNKNEDFSKVAQRPPSNWNPKNKIVPTIVNKKQTMVNNEGKAREQQ